MKRPRRILHYMRSLDPSEGGVVRFVLDLAAATALAGDGVILICQDDTGVPLSWPRAAAGGAGSSRGTMPSVVVVEGRGRFLGAEALRETREHITRCDVVHLHGAWKPENLQIAKAAYALGVPYVLTPHGMLNRWSIRQNPIRKKVFLRLARSFFERAERIHFTAEEERLQASEAMPSLFGKGQVIPCIFDSESYANSVGPRVARDQFSLDEHQLVFLYLGRLHPKKGLDILIDGWKQCVEQNIFRARGQLLIAGAGNDEYEQQLRSLAEEIRPDSRPRFLGPIEGDLKRSLYEASDLFVLPTHQENFGLVIAESLASGTPVVTTRGVDTWRTLEASGAVRIVSQDASGVMSALNWYADLPTDERERLRESARDFALSWLDRERLTGAYGRMYESVSGEG